MTQHTAAQYGTPDNLQARADTHRRFTRGPDLESAVDAALALTGTEALLDVGCGPGAFLARLRSGGHTGRLVGLDQSEGMLTHARAACPEAEWVQGSAEALPFPDGTFDVVTARHMLYHVPDIEQALREARRVLKPGGRFLAVTNTSDHLHELYVAFNAALSGIRGQHPDAQRFTERNGPDFVRAAFGTAEVTRVDAALLFPRPEDALPYFRSVFDEAIPDGAEDRFLAEARQQQTRDGWSVRKGVLLISAVR